MKNNITVYPSKGWTGSIDIGVPNVEPGVIYVSAERLARMKSAAKRKRQQILLAAEKERRKARRKKAVNDFVSFWKTNEIVRFLIKAIAIVIVIAFLGESIRLIRQAWWYAHHDIKDGISNYTVSQKANDEGRD